jgi:hypothetical protein
VKDFHSTKVTVYTHWNCYPRVGTVTRQNLASAPQAEKKILGANTTPHHISIDQLTTIKALLEPTRLFITRD